MRQEIENKIINLYYEYPNKRFTVREISNLTKIPRATVHKYVVEIKKKKFVGKDNFANNDIFFRTKKINFFIEKIVGSGLISEIVSVLNPSCVILFGSIRRGDSVKESDIDLFVESSIKKDVNLKKYERKLGHGVQLFIRKNMDELQPRLFNNVVNGIKIYGSFKIK
jgi:predicted nucleotidyltransferase